jgi:UDP-N-acetylglucosamine 4-epimerase
MEDAPPVVETCRIFGDGETTRDFCDIANVVQANLLAAAVNADVTRSVYNIACGESASVNQLFGTMSESFAIQQTSIRSCVQ